MNLAVLESSNTFLKTIQISLLSLDCQWSEGVRVIRWALFGPASPLQEWGWAAFEAIDKYARIAGGGYSSVNNVKTTKVQYRYGSQGGGSTVVSVGQLPDFEQTKLFSDAGDENDGANNEQRRFSWSKWCLLLPQRCVDETEKEWRQEEEVARQPHFRFDYGRRGGITVVKTKL